MASNKNDFGGGFFDFNGDGKTDIGEEWIAYQIFQECMKDNQKSNHKLHTSLNQRNQKPCQIKKEKAPISEIYTEEELKAECNDRRTTIICSLLAGIIMMIPVCVIVWAAYVTYDPRNSASGFLIAVFTIAGLAVGGVVFHTVWSEISEALKEVEELKESYKRNNKRK